MPFYFYFANGLFQTRVKGKKSQWGQKKLVLPEMFSMKSRECLSVCLAFCLAPLEAFWCLFSPRADLGPDEKKCFFFWRDCTIGGWKQDCWFPELSVLNESQMLVLTRRDSLVLCDWETVIILDKVSPCMDGGEGSKTLFFLAYHVRRKPKIWSINEWGDWVAFGKISSLGTSGSVTDAALVYRIPPFCEAFLPTQVRLNLPFSQLEDPILLTNHFIKQSQILVNIHHLDSFTWLFQAQYNKFQLHVV